MDTSLFFELSVTLGIVAGVSALMKALRQPLIIGYILSGLLLGPYVFDIIHSESTFDSFARFGIALLLFIIGLGLNPRVVKDVGRASAVVGLGQVTFTATIGFFIARLLGFEAIVALFIAVALTFSSTIIVLKILSDKKETNQLYGKIGIGVLLVQDLVASVVLLFVAGAGREGGTALVELAQTGLYTLLLVGGLLALQTWALPRFKNFLASSQEFLFIFALAWGFGVASLFAQIGLSIEVGAFFAGVLLATQPYSQEISSRLKPLRDFFILIFFIILGVELEFAAIGGLLPEAIALSLFVLIGNPLIVITLMGIQGYTKKTSFKLGLTVAQISEFSLIFILLGREVGQVGQEIVSLVTLVGLITIAASTYMMLFDDRLYEWFERYLSLFERRKVKQVQRPRREADIILIGFAKGGQEFVRRFKEMKARFLVIDYDPEAIDHLEHQKIPHLYGDVTDVEFLDEVNIENAKLVISTIADYNTNAFITSHVHALNKNTIIIPHSESPEEAAQLYALGATYVMMPHYIGSERVSHMIKRRRLTKRDFIPARERHLRYVEQHLG